MPGIGRCRREGSGGDPCIPTNLLRGVPMRSWLLLGLIAASLLPANGARRRGIEPVAVEGQPLAANAARVAQALEFLGTPLPEKTAAALKEAGAGRDAGRIQALLDPQALFVVTINPETRVKVERGPGRA